LFEIIHTLELKYVSKNRKILKNMRNKFALKNAIETKNIEFESEPIEKPIAKTNLNTIDWFLCPESGSN
jgi:hypothetical protein